MFITNWMTFSSIELFASVAKNNDMMMMKDVLVLFTRMIDNRCFCIQMFELTALICVWIWIICIFNWLTEWHCHPSSLLVWLKQWHNDKEIIIIATLLHSLIIYSVCTSHICGTFLCVCLLHNHLSCWDCNSLLRAVWLKLSPLHFWV